MKEVAMRQMHFSAKEYGDMYMHPRQSTTGDVIVSRFIYREASNDQLPVETTATREQLPYGPYPNEEVDFLDGRVSAFLDAPEDDE
jgi:hypothetical protein